MRSFVSEFAPEVFCFFIFNVFVTIQANSLILFFSVWLRHTEAGFTFTLIRIKHHFWIFSLLTFLIEEFHLFRFLFRKWPWFWSWLSYLIINLNFLTKPSTIQSSLFIFISCSLRVLLFIWWLLIIFLESIFQSHFFCFFFLTFFSLFYLFFQLLNIFCSLLNRSGIHRMDDP